MFRLDRALEAYRRAGSLNDRINLFGFIDDRVFLSKSGDVGVILAVKCQGQKHPDKERRNACATRVFALKTTRFQLRFVHRLFVFIGLVTSFVRKTTFLRFHSW